MRRVPTIQRNHGQPRGRERVGNESAGDAGADDGDIAAAIAGQWWCNFAEAVAEQPERLRRCEVHNQLPRATRTRLRIPASSTNREWTSRTRVRAITSRTLLSRILPPAIIEIRSPA